MTRVTSPVSLPFLTVLGWELLEYQNTLPSLLFVFSFYGPDDGHCSRYLFVVTPPSVPHPPYNLFR